MPSKFCILGSKRAINMAISLPECTHFALSYSSIRFDKALNLLSSQEGRGSGGVARGGRGAIAPPAALKTGAPKYS